MMPLLRPFKRFWRQPREVRLRRWLFQAHLWAGLSLGLLLAVVGLSGSLVVYKPEMEKALIPELSRVAPLPRTVPLDTLYARVQAHKPLHKLQSVALYGGREAAWNFRCVPPGGGRVQVYVDQYRGTVLGEVDFSATFLQWVYDLHADLLGGKTGRMINGFAGLALVLLCLTGLVIWWPGWPRLRQGFTFHRRSSWKGRNYDLHKLTGFYTALLLVLVALTGAYFPFKEEYNAIAAWLTGTAHTLPSPKLAAPEPGGQLAPLEQVLQNATAAMPDGENTLLRFPQQPEENFSMRKLRAGDWGRIGDNFVYLHHHTGQVLEVRYWRDLPLGVQVIQSMFPLHFGTFGGHFTRVLWLLLGIAPAALFGTGFMMWWNRVVAKRSRRRQPQGRERGRLQKGRPHQTVPPTKRSFT